MKVALRFKNPYFASNYNQKQKITIKKGLIKLLLGSMIIAFTSAGLNYLEHGKFGLF